MDRRAADDHAGAGAARRRVHRVGHRRVHDHRARAQGAARRRTAQDFALLHPVGDHQPGGRPGVDPVRREGAELGDLHGLLGVGARDRRRLRDHPPRRRRRDDCGRVGGRDHADGHRRLRRAARAVDAQRRAASAPAGRSTWIATASSSAKAPACSILEELEGAQARGAKIYAELVGYGMSADAYHITAPSEDGDGAVPRDERGASRAPASRPAQVDYINAHGTSTPHGDRIETLAIKRCFGDHARKLAVSSTKSMTGHLLGAAGGLEAGITTLAVHHQLAPPTINLDSPDVECDLDYVPNTKRALRDRVRAVELVRLRRHQRGAAVQAIRSMKIAVCIKQVPTRDWQPRRRRTGPWIREQDASYEMNEPDAYALEESAAPEGKARRGSRGLLGRARPRGPGAARGAGPRRRPRDSRRGRRLASADAFAVAACAGGRDEGRAVRPDPDRAAVRRSGLRADRRRCWPSGSACRTPRSSWKSRPPKPALRVKRELEGGWFQWVSMPLPAVLTIQSGINQLRYATLKGIMAAKKKEIRKAAWSSPARSRADHPRALCA